MSQMVSRVTRIQWERDLVKTYDDIDLLSTDFINQHF